MNKNGRLLAVNYAALPGAVIESSAPDAGDFQIGNIVDSDPDLIMKSDPGTWVITVRLDRLRTIDAVALCAHNLTPSSSVGVKFFNGTDEVFVLPDTPAVDPLYGAFDYPGAFSFGAFGSADFTDPTEPVAPYSDFYSPAPVGADSVQITITDITLTELLIGYFYVGLTFTPKINFELGSGIGFLPQPDVVNTPAGATLGMHRHPKREAELSWARLTPSEKTTLYNLTLLFQTLENPVFYSGYPEAENVALREQNKILGFPTNWSKVTPGSPIHNRFQLTLREIYYYA